MSQIDDQVSTLRYLSWGNKRFISAPSSKVFFISLIVVFVSIIVLTILSFIFTIELSIQAQGKTKRVVAPMKVYGLAGSQVSDILVKAGDKVAQGASLIELKSGDETSMVYAASSGVIGQVDVSIGEWSVDKKPLLQILSPNKQVVIDAFVSPGDMAKIHVGMKVYAAIDAFSKSKYGYFDGTVKGVDLISQDTSRGLSDVSEKYKITIVLNETSLKKIGVQKLYPGMNVDLKIVWKKDKVSRIISNFLLQKPD